MDSDDKIFIAVLFFGMIVAIAALVLMVQPGGTQLVQAEPGQPIFVEKPVYLPQAAQTEQPMAIETPVEEPVEDPVPVDTRTMAQRYLDEFDSKVTKYSYTVGCEVHGPIHVLNTPGFIRYKALEHLFEYDNETNTVGLSHVHSAVAENCARDPVDWSSMTSAFYKDFKKGKLDVMNYVWYDKGTETYQGCFIISSRGIIEKCLDDNDDEPVIFTNFTFEHPPSPRDVLEEYVGREPSRVIQGLEYVIPETTNKVEIDELYFANDDGTTDRLTVHTYFKIPLRRDVLKDGRIVRGVVYRAITFN